MKQKPKHAPGRGQRGEHGAHEQGADDELIHADGIGRS
jgi:hypothetical protein